MDFIKKEKINERILESSSQHVIIPSTTRTVTRSIVTRRVETVKSIDTSTQEPHAPNRKQTALTLACLERHDAPYLERITEHASWFRNSGLAVLIQQRMEVAATSVKYMVWPG